MHYAVACYLGLWRAGAPRAGGDALSASWVDPDSLSPGWRWRLNAW